MVQALYKGAGVYLIMKPRSRNGRRRISLSRSLIEVIQQHRLDQEIQGILLGRQIQETNLVFSYPGNRLLNPGTVTHVFAKVLKEAGLPHLRFHDLRHSHASFLLVAGVNVKVVSERLGHVSVAFTLDTYGHVMPGMQESAVEELDRYLLPGLTDNEDTLRELFLALAGVGVKHTAISVLFLRRSVTESLKRNIHDKELLNRLLGFYKEARPMAIHAERSSVIALPSTTRNDIYTKIGQIAEGHGIKLSICACKNPDLAHGTCNIGRTWPKSPETHAQGNLFEQTG